MNLTAIDIKNFRGFDHLKVDDFSQINIFLGKNNSGKTSLMEAILLSISSTHPLALFELNHIREVGERNLSSLQGFFYNLSFDNAPSITADFTDKDGGQSQRQINVKATSEILSTLPATTQSEHKRESSVSFTSAPPVNQINIVTSFSNSERIVETQLNFDEDNQVSVTKQNSVVYSISAMFLPSNATEEPALERVGYLKRVKREQPLVYALQQIDARIKNIQVIGTKIYLDVDGADELMPFSLMGDGLKKIVSVLASVIDITESTIVLIDEIENGLHYSSHLKLWNALLAITALSGNQLFITTHNVETLRYLHKALEQHENMQSKVRLYDLIKTKKAGFQAYKYTYEGFSNALENETEIRL